MLMYTCILAVDEVIIWFLESVWNMQQLLSTVHVVSSIVCGVLIPSAVIL